MSKSLAGHVFGYCLEEYEGNEPGFDFLGFFIRQYKVKSTNQGFKTLIKPSAKSIKTHYWKLANICDFPLTINVGSNNRISKPVTSRIAYTAVIDVLTMGVAQLKPEAQEHLYNIADSQRSLKVDG